MTVEVSSFTLFIYGIIISAFSIALQEQIKKAIQWIPKTVWGYTYSRWGGTRFFRRASIKKYKSSIMRQYSKIYIPFRPSHPLILQEIYVPLRLYQSQIKESSQIKEKIDTNEAIKKYNRLVVIGEPGSGKSTMLRHALLSYINDSWNKSLDSKFPILLELNRFTNPNSKLFDELLLTLSKNEFPNGKEFLRKCLEKGNLIIFMDGLDEIDYRERGRVIQDIKDMARIYSKISFVISCRSAVYNNELDDIIDQTLEIIEFDDQQISKFLTSWEKEIPSNKSINQLLKTLYDRPLIMELARNPLMLTIIAYLYCDTEHELPHSRAEFYKISCDVLLRLWHREQNNKYPAPSKKEVLKHLALFNQDNFKDSSRRTIDYKSIMEEIRKILPLLNIKTEESELILKDIVERSGLLVSIEGGDAYQFAHLTLQEYFAAEALGDNQEGLINRFSDSSDTWHETVKLWCGLGYDCTNLIKKLYDIDSTFAFECLADAVKVDNELANKIISEFELKFKVEISSENVQRAFGTVASNLKTSRGSNAFEFLVTILESDNLDPKIRQNAAFSLSVTNLPEAAEALVRNISSFGKCKSSLIRMGNLAVTALTKSNKTSSTDYVDILLEIGTPEAAKAIVPCLWDTDDKVSYAAAWNLGSLLRDKNIEEVLGKEALRNHYFLEEIDQGTYDWIWSPFEDFSSLSISKICGRIGYILDTFDHIPSSFEDLKLDKRISVPLFISNLSDSEYRVIKLLSEENSSILLHFENFENSPNIELSNEKMKKRELQDDLINEVHNILKSNKHLSLFFNCMDESVKFKLISMFQLRRKLSKKDWIKMNKKSKLDFSTDNVVAFVTIPIAIMSYGYMFCIALNKIFSLSNLSNTNGFPMNYNLIFAFLLIIVIIFWLIYLRYYPTDNETFNNIAVILCTTTISIPILITIIPIVIIFSLIIKSRTPGVMIKHLYLTVVKFGKPYFGIIFGVIFVFYFALGAFSVYSLYRFMSETLTLSFFDIVIFYTIIMLMIIFASIKSEESSNQLEKIIFSSNNS